jgi:hypothetical protein
MSSGLGTTFPGMSFLFCCNTTSAEKFFTDTRWTTAPTGLPQMSHRKGRGVYYLKRARNTTRLAPRHRTPQLTPVHTWTLLLPFRYRVWLILGGGPKACVIYPRVV